MRKISKTRRQRPDHPTSDTYLEDTGQRRIPGATITSWPGATHIDLATFFGRTVSDTTIASAASGHADPFSRTAHRTVSLSDGTRITFATVGPFDMVELA